MSLNTPKTEEREQHTTGAVRDSAKGRGRPDLISPFMLQRLARHLEKGAEKYAERNWERGIPLCRSYASMMRHAWQWFMRATDEDHLAAVICNAMFILHTLEMIERDRLPATLDDRPDYSPKAKEGKPDSPPVPKDSRTCAECGHYGFLHDAKYAQCIGEYNGGPCPCKFFRVAP